MEDNKLSTVEYWDEVYKSNYQTKNILKLKFHEHFELHHLLGKETSKTSKPSVLEVGSAPGDYLVKFSKLYNIDPYGVEYTENGVEINRRLFKENGLNPDNVIHSDFFSDLFQEKFKSKFGIVISRGFIEHFDNPKEVVEKHISLVKPGGIVMITIPNISGLNRLLSRFFCPESLKIHNLTIMNKKSYSTLFDSEGIDVEKLGYYGSINFGLFYSEKGKFNQFILKLLLIKQEIINKLLRILPVRLHPNCRAISPYLVCIARRK
jgi:2-polyprenyl-3-methyl-5-hydroxy-6-metoxy-1,4-benzoquinol methylase